MLDEAPLRRRFYIPVPLQKVRKKQGTGISLRSKAPLEGLTNTHSSKMSLQTFSIGMGIEYEKTARGPSPVVSGEYVWGSTSITGATSITNGGTVFERGQAGSNITYNNAGGVQGPTRVGSFGSGGVTSRVATGASYYGVFDLSGNDWERPVTVGNSTGRIFKGVLHGDGNLATNGDANPN